LKIIISLLPINFKLKNIQENMINRGSKGLIKLGKAKEEARNMSII